MITPTNFFSEVCDLPVLSGREIKSSVHTTVFTAREHEWYVPSINSNADKS